MNSPKKETILLAEDDYLVSKEIERKVKQLGYQVAGIAPNGEKAVEMAYTLKPDLILMDIKMPILDGLAASRLIQEKCQIPIIILTAYESFDLFEEATDIGVLSYLVKPPKTDDMERAIAIALARFKDLTELRQVKLKLEKSLNEKETLFKEIHHRVKNNMTVISSLLKLQLSVVKDEKAKEALQDSQNRVQTMSMIHETLYRSDDLSFIDMQTYLSELGRTILQSYTVGDNVNLKVESENIMIGVKQASSLGLIVNELITNSLKYAFPDNKKGEIVLTLKSIKEDMAELIVFDNGDGITEDFDLQNADSLGLKLVRTLVENQLDGSIDLNNANGTKFTIKFSIETQS